MQCLLLCDPTFTGTAHSVHQLTCAHDIFPAIHDRAARKQRNRSKHVRQLVELRRSTSVLAFSLRDFCFEFVSQILTEVKCLEVRLAV